MPPQERVSQAASIDRGSISLLHKLTDTAKRTSVEIEQYERDRARFQNEIERFSIHPIFPSIESHFRSIQGPPAVNTAALLTAIKAVLEQFTDKVSSLNELREDYERVVLADRKKDGIITQLKTDIQNIKTQQEILEQNMDITSSTPQKDIHEELRFVSAKLTETEEELNRCRSQLEILRNENSKMQIVHDELDNNKIELEQLRQTLKEKDNEIEAQRKDILDKKEQLDRLSPLIQQNDTLSRDSPHNIRSQMNEPSAITVHRNEATPPPSQDLSETTKIPKQTQSPSTPVLSDDLHRQLHEASITHQSDLDQIKSLQNEILELNRHQQHMINDCKEQKRIISRLTTENEILSQTLSTLQAELSTKSQSLSSLSSSLNGQLSEKEELSKELERVRKELDLLRAKPNDLASLDSADDSELDRLREENIALQSRIDRQTKETAYLKEKVLEKDSKLRRMEERKKKGKSEKELAQMVAEASREKDASRAENMQLTEQLATLHRRIESLTNELRKVSLLNSELSQVNTRLRSKHTTLHREMEFQTMRSRG
ncbi:hypothetical protein BLNAU_9030 [Blattamonas nauphoetae]|uniref:Uncharacterized protein n=1 Tax=Blattamonas nauphoetae TaxID=2049346 RepID=A0ABQ9XX43_9EUKA|nr:hypothetical protein BLNAU_9030 [Blattamonas nauphoetae]